jgi:hypothetical protein
VTLRFFPDSQDETCSYTNSSQALTFTTDSVPVVSHCFNIADLFGGNTTNGFVDQIRNVRPLVDGHVGIAWQLENMDTLDPKASTTLGLTVRIESTSMEEPTVPKSILPGPGTFWIGTVSIVGVRPKAIAGPCRIAS